MNALIALLSRFFSRKPVPAPAYLKVVLAKDTDGPIIPSGGEYRLAFYSLARTALAIPSDSYEARNAFLAERNTIKVKAHKARKSLRIKVKASRKRNR